MLLLYILVVVGKKVVIVRKITFLALEDDLYILWHFLKATAE